MTIHVEVGPGITVSTADGSRVTLPRPRSGYGGHEVVVSPSGRHAALFLYSGQSEVGYELFDLEGGLRHVGGLPYVHGEGDAPVFSPDSRYLAMAWAWMARGGGLPFEEDPDHDAKRAEPVTWAEVLVHALPDGPVERRPVLVDLGGWRPSENDVTWLAPTNVRFVDERTLSMRTPWGRTVTIAVPLGARVTVPGRG